MKAIFFPFTYTSDAVAEALAACFGKFVVYQPLSDKVPLQMQTLANTGMLDVRVPVIENEKELESAAKNYLAWANLHINGSGTKIAFLKTLQDSISFFSNASPSQIAADIKNHTHSSLPAKAPDPTLAARIFLYFAQEFDRQSQEVDHDLKWYSQKEVDLMQELKMEEDSKAGEFQKKQMQMPDVSTVYMLADRLEAWTRIMLKDPEASGLFVTNSPAIMDQLLDKSPMAKKIFYFESIPLDGTLTVKLDSWRHKLVANLAQIVKAKRPALSQGPPDMPAFPAAVNTVSLSVYLVPDQIPSVFFPSCAEINRPAGNEAYHTGRFKNTLISLVEF